MLVQSAIDQKGKILEGDFKNMNELLRTLETFATSYSGEPRSSKSFKPGAFEKVEILYANLTRH